jgi:hypothetical protein
MFVRKALVAVGSMCASVAALAVTQIDYSTAVTSATTEVTGAITAALPIGILVLSAVVGWKLFKRFAR